MIDFTAFLQQFLDEELYGYQLENSCVDYLKQIKEKAYKNEPLAINEFKIAETELLEVLSKYYDKSSKASINYLRAAKDHLGRVVNEEHKKQVEILKNTSDAMKSRLERVKNCRDRFIYFKQTTFAHCFKLEENPEPNEALPPQQAEKLKPEQKQPETLNSIITHNEAETLVSGIKTQYKNIKGKRLKLLLIALQELELLPKDRIAKKFHTLCNNEFDWEIASYNAMNGYNFNSHTDTDDVEGMKQYIKTLLNTK